jgi:hypothetical protein
MRLCGHIRDVVSALQALREVKFTPPGTPGVGVAPHDIFYITIGIRSVSDE